MNTQQTNATMTISPGGLHNSVPSSIMIRSHVRTKSNVTTALQRIGSTVAQFFVRSNNGAPFISRQPDSTDQTGNVTQVYQIGDIVLKDGSAVSTKEITAEQKNDAVAIIFRPTANGHKAMGVGIHCRANVPWCTSVASAYRTTVTPEEVRTEDRGIAHIASFLGKDSDIISEGKYPAFYYAQNYGASQRIAKNLQDGWYLPDITELSEIWKTKSSINTAIRIAGGSELTDDLYFSSSQSQDFKKCARVFNFIDGNEYVSIKTLPRHVCAVHFF